MILQILAAFVLATVGFVAQAQAHGNVSSDSGRCQMQIGPDTMAFTGYQPDKSRDTFCDDIPDVGRTIIVLDAEQDELRDMLLEMRILRDVGQASDDENMEQNTETYVPPKKYKTGTLNFEHDFAQKGKFIGLVKAKSEDGTREYVARFPFTVGTTTDRELTAALFLTAVAAVGFGLVFRQVFMKKKAS